MGKIQQLDVNTNKNIEEVAHGIHQLAFVWKEIFLGNLNSVLPVYRNVDCIFKKLIVLYLNLSIMNYLKFLKVNKLHYNNLIQNIDI